MVFLLNLYQATFYLSTVLLAITIAVFVLAVSLLGRAVRISIVEQERNQKEVLSRNRDSMKKLREQFQKATKGQSQPNINSIQKNINRIIWRQRLSRLKLIWICIKPNFLQVPLGVLLPGSLFIIAIASSNLAIYFESSSHNTALIFWYTSILTMIIGTIVIILTLRVTQSVAITSEETSRVREKEVFISALQEYEESKKPVLLLGFSTEQPPFTLSIDQNKEIEFTIYLSKGDIARKPEVHFFAPLEFEFPGQKSLIQPDTYDTIGGHRSTAVKFIDCKPQTNLRNKLSIKAPSQSGKYVLYYQISCELFVGNKSAFTVIVE